MTEPAIQTAPLLRLDGSIIAHRSLTVSLAAFLFEHRANLRSADLSGANLSRADLSGANLSGVLGRKIVRLPVGDWRPPVADRHESEWEIEVRDAIRESIALVTAACEGAQPSAILE